MFFLQEIQIFKVFELGEEERNEPQYQVFCFIIPFQANEFITSDAMSKLRQVRMRVLLYMVSLHGYQCQGLIHM